MIVIIGCIMFALEFFIQKLMKIAFGYHLREVIGSPRGLAICTDAGRAMMVGVGEVFLGAEHRECMFHLVSNFKKRYHGKVFDDHLWVDEPIFV